MVCLCYNYNSHEEWLFTDEGQRDFLKVRDHVNTLLKSAGAVAMGKAINVLTGDVWNMMACVDRMVELEEIVEITEGVAGQDRIFVAVNRYKGR